MVYSGARFSIPFSEDRLDDLEQAQLRKIDFHLGQCQFKPEFSILDIGCGWGALLRRATKDFNAKLAVGLTLSEDQLRFIEAGQHKNVEAHLCSWEHFNTKMKFDRVVSIGAFEHFARPGITAEQKMEIYSDFFRSCHRWLQRDGHLSLQTIVWGGQIRRRDSAALLPLDIFPESDLPYIDELCRAGSEKFQLMYAENGTEDYITTLEHWQSRLQKSSKSPACIAVGEKTVAHYDRYLRRALAGFRRKRMELFRFTFQPR